MKSLNILAASVLAAASVGTASAQVVAGATEIHISGATTYRAPVTKAIQNVMNITSFAYDGSSIFGAGAAIFAGTLKNGGQSVIVKTYWSGSLAGLIDISAPNTISSWIDSSVTRGAPTNGAGSPLTGGANVTGTTYAKESHFPEATLSDAFSDSGSKSVATAPNNGTTYANLITNAALVNAGSTGAGKAGGSKTVGIVPFQWVAGIQTSGIAPYTNITQQVANSLIFNGTVPMTSLTGSTANQYDYAFLVGRNEDSGTRIAAFAEAQAGFGNSALQYKITFANNATNGTGIPTGGAGATVKALDFWTQTAKLNTVSAIDWNTEGHSGYVGGGDVANVLSAGNPLTLAGDSTSTTGSTIFNITGDGVPSGWDTNGAGTSKAYLIGYLGVADASKVANATISGSSRVALTYNGVAYSPANVYNGTYTFWAFEHLFYRTTGTNAISATGKVAVDQLADQIFTSDAQTDSSGATTAGVPASTSTVAGLLFNANALFTRTREGTIPTPNY